MRRPPRHQRPQWLLPAQGPTGSSRTAASRAAESSAVFVHFTRNEQKQAKRRPDVDGDGDGDGDVVDDGDVVNVM